MEVGVPCTTTGALFKPSRRAERRPTWDELLDAAALIGVSDEDFWLLTWTEFDRKQWAHLRHEEARYKLMLKQAWYTASYTRTKRLPSLQIVLNPEARVVRGEEKARLQAEHEQMMKAMGVS